MKKIVSSVLVFMLTVGAVGSLGYAAPKHKGWLPPGQAKKHFMPYGISKKVFDDIDGYDWAKKAIESMKLKGLIKGEKEGIFNPSKSVSKLETIIMALRVMGYEDEAYNIKDLPDEYSGERIDQWARGYVTIAYEKGILDDVDMMYFVPSESAKRYEVAKYIIRAIGYEDEAEEHMDEELDFTDASMIPQGAIGYIYMTNELELMMGDSKDRFNPMGTLNRAEMAVLFSRLDEKVDSDVDKDEWTGNVYEIDDDYIKIKVYGNIKKFEVDDDVIVYDDNKRVRYNDIEEDDIVKLTIDDDEVVYIEIIEDEDNVISTYRGEVININKNHPEAIQIEVRNMSVMFYVLDDVDVIFEDEKGDFDDIEEDDEVKLYVDRNNKVRKIIVDRDLDEDNEDKEYEVKGRITDLDLVGTYHMEIDDDKYKISKDADIEIEDERNKFENLAIGMKVEVKIDDEEIIDIEAEWDELEIEGEIKSIKYVSDGIEIAIEDDDDTYKYILDKDVEIEIDDDDKDERDLEVGQYGEFEIVKNKIVKIDIEED